MQKIGIIGGSGLYELPGLDIEERVSMETPFGTPSDAYLRGGLNGKELFFLPRHGSQHRIAPHKINYRANIWGFRQLGVERVISIGASGAIQPSRVPGSLTVPDQIIDFTSGRRSTFYEDDQVAHIDFTNPFCQDLRGYIASGADRSGVSVDAGGVYIAVNGPRLETAAEIRTFSLWGAEVIGMTAMPEAALAREAGICFAMISVVTNFAAGIGAARLTATEVVACMEASAEKLRHLVGGILSVEFREPLCGCRRSLEDARM